MRRAIVLAAMLALAGCSQAPSSEIPPGRYSGSTSDDRGVTVDVAGNTVRVNGKRARFLEVDDNRAFVATRMPGKPTWRCEPVADGEELRCEVRWPDRAETVEMMRE